MTQEEKDLLLKDLCARLPYGVKVLVDNKTWCDFDGRTPSKLTFDNSYRLLFLGTDLGYVKPYLFPLSSITEEQWKELTDLQIQCELQSLQSLGSEPTISPISISDVYTIDWLNKNHFDYRGLIEKDLAINATGLNIY